MIPKTSNNLVFTMGNAGAQLGATDLTAASGRAVTVTYMAATTLDATGALEAAQLKQAIADKVDGIMISCISDSVLSPLVDQAVAAKIPVITFDSDCPSSTRDAYYSMDSQQTGATAADLLDAVIGKGSKTVGIVTGQPSENLDDRVAGFTSRLAATYPDLNVVETVSCNEDVTCGVPVEAMVMKYPNLDGLLLVGLWDLLAACSPDGTTCTDDLMPNWKAAAKKGLKTVAYDSLPFELMLMNQGYISALLGQKYFGWGYVTSSLLFDIDTENRVVSGFINSGFDIVCPNNVDAMSAKWQASNFTQPLPPCSLLPLSGDGGQ
jgi:ribose transport system substrate-binding protein